MIVVGRGKVNANNDELKRIIFRPQNWLKQDIKSYMNIHRIKSKTKGIHEYIESLKNEVERYKVMIAQNVNANNENVEIKETKLEEKFPCYSRFEHEGSYFCVTNKGQCKRLSTLKICGACTKRITKEIATKQGIVMKTEFYVTCGAKQHQDSKKGLMLYCEKGYGGQYVTLEDCKNAGCHDLKEIKTTPK